MDLVAQVKETNCITWIAPSKCSKRDSEVQNSLKEKPMILSLEQQMVKLATPTEQLVADTSTDYGKRFQRLEVFPVGEKGEVWGGRYRFADFGVPNGC